MVRTIPDLAKAMQPLEDAIRQKFLPALLGRTVNDLERELFSLPARFAGLGIANPCTRRKAIHDLGRSNSTASRIDPSARTQVERKTHAKVAGFYSGNTKKSDRGSFRGRLNSSRSKSLTVRPKSAGRNFWRIASSRGCMASPGQFSP